MALCLPALPGGIEFPMCWAAGSIVSLTVCYGLMEQALLESSTGCILDLPLYYKSVAAGRRYLKSINCVYSVHHCERLYSEGSRPDIHTAKCAVWVLCWIRSERWLGKEHGTVAQLCSLDSYTYLRVVFLVT